MPYFRGLAGAGIEVALKKMLVRLHFFGEQLKDKNLILALDNSMGWFDRERPKGDVISWPLLSLYYYQARTTSEYMHTTILS